MQRWQLVGIGLLALMVWCWTAASPALAAHLGGDLPLANITPSLALAFLQKRYDQQSGYSAYKLNEAFWIFKPTKAVSRIVSRFGPKRCKIW